MKIITFDTIKKLNISPAECVDWVKKVFVNKQENILHAKDSIKLDGNIFFNTMPCYLKSEKKVGVKVVSRFPQKIPALNSDLLLYDAETGDSLCLMDATWITTMRTGAVAALAALTFKHSNTTTFSFVGLGNTARATLLCLLSQIPPEVKINVNLYEYKNQAPDFIERFKSYNNIIFNIESDLNALIAGSDVLFSCVTAFDNIVAPDDVFPEGILLIPVHTRGWQTCDLFFDKVFADDTDHVCNFKYFDKFKHFAEFSDVLNGKAVGRENDRERILSYNIGIALHDVYFASQIYKKCDSASVVLSSLTQKFWV